MNEFDLIKKYFSSFSAGFNIEEGIGDDCALVNIPKGETLAISTDTLVENIHFFKDVDPYSLGFKSLAITQPLLVLTKWSGVQISSPCNCLLYFETQLSFIQSLTPLFITAKTLFKLN